MGLREPVWVRTGSVLVNRPVGSAYMGCKPIFHSFLLGFLSLLTYPSRSLFHSPTSSFLFSPSSYFNFFLRFFPSPKSILLLLLFWFNPSFSFTPSFSFYFLFCFHHQQLQTISIKSRCEQSLKKSYLFEFGLDWAWCSSRDRIRVRFRRVCFDWYGFGLTFVWSRTRACVLLVHSRLWCACDPDSVVFVLLSVCWIVLCVSHWRFCLRVVGSNFWALCDVKCVLVFDVWIGTDVEIGLLGFDWDGLWVLLDSSLNFAIWCLVIGTDGLMFVTWLGL